MRYLLRFALLLVAGAGWASAQDLKAVVASPEKLAAYLEGHPDFDWEAVGAALAITDQNVFLPRCEAGGFGEAACTAELVRVAEPRQTIVILEHRASWRQVFLRYRDDGQGGWQFSGAWSPLTKYFRPEHWLRQVGARPFLVVTSQGISGSGVASKIEEWFDLTSGEFESVLGFPAAGHFGPFPAGVGRNTTGRVVQVKSRPREQITVQFHVEFFPEDGGGKTFHGVSRSDRVVYVRDAAGEFQVDEGLSSAKAADVEDIYNIQDRPEIEDSRFVRFAMKGLLAVAAGPGDARFRWLAGFLERCPDTVEVRELRKIIRARKAL